jgi:hypothetical protein
LISYWTTTTRNNQKSGVSIHHYQKTTTTTTKITQVTMCVANLNASTKPCSHRWYTLTRPCNPTSNLSNCPSKLALQGWETRLESCPWCDDSISDTDMPNDNTHRLLGGSSTPRSRSRSGSLVLAGVAAVAPSVGVADQRCRRQSSATNSTASSTQGMEDADEADVYERGERARMMNWRLDVYLTSHPERKQREDSAVVVSSSEVGLTRSPSTLSRQGSIRRSGSLLGKSVKKGFRLSRTIFKG